MNAFTNTARILWVVLCAIVVSSPLFHADGFFWILAVVASYTVYRGLYSEVVFGGFLLLFLLEAMYGVRVGVLSIAYLFSAFALLGLQRFIVLRPWSERDGWSFYDALQATVLSWLYTMFTIWTSVFVGNALYRFGALWVRTDIVTEPLLGITVGILCALTLIIVRRMTIPFRRAILFGL